MTKISILALALFSGTLSFANSSHADAETLKYFVAKDSWGHVLRLTQKEAIRYCTERDAHLITLRQAAEMLSRNCDGLSADEPCGARGIVKPADATLGGNVDGRDLISGRDDAFFFDYTGFRLPTGVLGANEFWTSTAAVLDPNDFSFSAAGWAVSGARLEVIFTHRTENLGDVVRTHLPFDGYYYQSVHKAALCIEQ